IEAPEDASERGVDIRLILDANKNAFGNNKAGLPNVPIANELHAYDNMTIRWYESGEDQYHTKLLFVEKEAENIIIGGSANHTTINLDDLNLENNLKIIAAKDSEVSQDVKTYFEKLRGNKEGDFTADYETNEGAPHANVAVNVLDSEIDGIDNLLGIEKDVGVHDTSVFFCKISF